jgi:glycosyltransferase involved in cell wall biosynthesis
MSRLQPTSRSPKGTSGTITSIGIVTADRPAALKRCLSSVLTHCRDHGNTPRVIVVDGSRDLSLSAANLSTIESFREYSHCPLTYVSPHSDQDIQSCLMRVGLSAASIKTMLCPGGPGAGRNLLMLMTVGEHVMFLDDDVVCAPWAARTRRNGLAVAGHRDPRVLASFPNREEALSATVPVAVDLLAAHSRLLDRDLTALLDRPGTEVDISGMCTHVSSALLNRRPQRVRTTFTGIAGDAGMYCPHRVLAKANPPSELTRDLAAFDKAVRSREVVRVVSEDTVTHHPFLMGYCMALANRGVFPPFIPVGRNEDGLFAEMLALIDPGALFGHISYGIVHDSHRAAAYPANPVSASETRLADLILWLVRRNQPEARIGSPASRLRHIADSFSDLARMESGTFASLCIETVLRARAGELALAEAACERNDAGPHWREALGRYREAFQHAVRSPRFFVPIEFHDRCDSDASVAFRAVQDLLQAFSEIVHALPALRACGVLRHAP